MRFRLYVKDCVEQPGPNSQLSESDGVEVWRPSWQKLLPPDSPQYPFLAFWLFHQFGVFKNPDYRVLFIKEGNRLVRRCCVLPPFFRYPFMRNGELNIGTWTHPEHRRGLAAHTLQKAITCSSQRFRRIWYITRETNAPSMQLAERCDFVFFGTGKRVTTFGSSILGRFVVDTLLDGTCPHSLGPAFFDPTK